MAEADEEVTSQRLNEYFGATVDVDLKGNGPDVATELSSSFSEGAPSPPAESALPASHSYAELMGEALAPAGTDMRLSHGALSEGDTRYQRGELSEAAKLIKSMGAPGSDAAIVATCDKDGCHYELSINWDGAFVACATQRMTALPMSMIEICGLLREPELIPLPRWPGLPRLETVSIVHEYSPNNVVYHVGIEPWGPFPGVDSIAVAVAFVRPDGAIVGFARSPPEADAKVHRGWTVLPVQKRRKRMELDGCAWVVMPRTDGKVDVSKPRLGLETVAPACVIALQAQRPNADHTSTRPPPRLQDSLRPGTATVASAGGCLLSNPLTPPSPPSPRAGDYLYEDPHPDPELAHPAHARALGHPQDLPAGASAPHQRKDQGAIPPARARRQT
jgi:hypothetical protein